MAEIHIPKEIYTPRLKFELLLGLNAAPEQNYCSSTHKIIDIDKITSLILLDAALAIVDGKESVVIVYGSPKANAFCCVKVVELGDDVIWSPTRDKKQRDALLNKFKDEIEDIAELPSETIFKELIKKKIGNEFMYPSPL